MRLTLFCRECEYVSVLAHELGLHIDSTFDMPPGFRLTSVRWVEGDRVEVVGLCTTCEFGPKIDSMGPKAMKLRADVEAMDQRLREWDGS